MPRTARASVGNTCYHILNRGNARNTVFHKDGDYGAFLKLLNQANDRVSMRLLAFCLMPNHFHLVAWPRNDGDLSKWMQWLMTSHVRRYHRHYDSSGHVWQGRFKAFPIQSDEHLLTVMRCVERNPVRAKSIPVRKAQHWSWSSAGITPREFESVRLHAGPVKRRPNWVQWVNQPLNETELIAMQEYLQRGRPFGSQRWQKSTAKKMGLESTMRPRGRPRNTEK
ncbi:transposase [Pirellulaceae bacterium]|nr:transposase [Pirellulaceae bacterium]